ncbi:unnamed protein product [Arabis nemorensis]|uniref:Uncharacterized protein n=1 Tax=Arabis nemorensis TaxID=586526 RepID=A0A565BFC0_9BRAS|nr:unnamed protein product [Arabis nemorensis]
MVDGTRQGAIKKKNQGTSDANCPHLTDKPIDGLEMIVHKPTNGVDNASEARDGAASANFEFGIS